MKFELKTLTVIVSSIATIFLFSCKNNVSIDPVVIVPGNQTDIAWPSLAKSSWPMHGHDPMRTGRSNHAVAAKGVIRWIYQASGNIICSPAVAEDGTIYIVTSNDTIVSGSALKSFLTALSPNGTLKWRFPIQDTTMVSTVSGQVSPIVGSDGTIFLANEKDVLAVNPNGTLQWRYRISARIFTIGMVIGKDGVLYFVGDDHFLYAINATGSLRWKIRPDQGFMATAQNVITMSSDGAMLYLQGVESALYAVSTDAEVKWKVPFEEKFWYGIASLNEGKTFLSPSSKSSAMGTHAAAFLLNKDGGTVWKSVYDTSGFNNTVAAEPAIGYSGSVYFGISTPPSLISLSYDGKKNWIRNVDQGTSIITDKYENIYFADGDGKNIYSYSQSGTLRWSIPLQGLSTRAYNSPAVGINGDLYITCIGGIPATSKGTLYAIE
jgi:outer membrane protein assembly factor BamB